MTTLHLTDEQISILVDGGMNGRERALLHEHMSACEDCYRAYEDALRYRGILETDASVFRVTDEMLAVARNVSRAGLRRAPDPSPHRPLFRRLWVPVLGGVATAAALVVAVVMWLPDRKGEQYSNAVRPVMSAVVDASTGGAIVIPGTEASVAATVPMYRTGQVTQSDELDDALDQLTRLYQTSRIPEVAHWLISGYLATGRLDMAQVYVQDARVRFPDDARFLILDGLVSYCVGDMPRAERVLQAALSSDPNNGTALVNLGLVQYEQGRWDDARRTFETVRARFSGTPLDIRAETLLNGLLNG